MASSGKCPFTQRCYCINIAAFFSSKVSHIAHYFPISLHKLAIQINVTVRKKQFPYVLKLLPVRWQVGQYEHGFVNGTRAHAWVGKVQSLSSSCCTRFDCTAGFCVMFWHCSGWHFRFSKFILLNNNQARSDLYPDSLFVLPKVNIKCEHILRLILQLITISFTDDEKDIIVMLHYIWLGVGLSHWTPGFTSNGGQLDKKIQCGSLWQDASHCCLTGSSCAQKSRVVSGGTSGMKTLPNHLRWALTA